HQRGQPHNGDAEERRTTQTLLVLHPRIIYVSRRRIDEQTLNVPVRAMNPRPLRACGAVDVRHATRKPDRRSTMSKLTTVAIAALAALVVSGTAALAANQAMSPKLVRTIIDKQLGEVLTTSEKQAIYIWKSESKGT